MPRKLSDRVSESRRRANEYGQRARTGIDARLIERLLAKEQRWFSLARARDHGQRAGRRRGVGPK